ncbi:hypothetical protein NFI96_006922 [Prochilodus magdalenae]|nr:hypothetical protein NFI96_006922 [Prochilodus magdalenae]
MVNMRRALGLHTSRGLAQSRSTGGVTIIPEVSEACCPVTGSSGTSWMSRRCAGGGIWQVGHLWRSHHYSKCPPCGNAGPHCGPLEEQLCSSLQADTLMNFLTLLKSRGAETQRGSALHAENLQRTPHCQKAGLNTQGLNTQGLNRQGPAHRVSTRRVSTGRVSTGRVPHTGSQHAGSRTQGLNTQGLNRQGPAHRVPTRRVSTGRVPHTGSQHAGSQQAGSRTQGLNTQGPNRQGLNTQGPNTQGPNTQGPNTQGPNTQAPNRQGPNTQGPNTQGPNTQGPNTQGPNTQGPNTQGLNTQGPNAQGPNAQGQSKSTCRVERVWLLLCGEAIVFLSVGILTSFLCLVVDGVFILLNIDMRPMRAGRCQFYTSGNGYIYENYYASVPCQGLTESCSLKVRSGTCYCCDLYDCANGGYLNNYYEFVGVRSCDDVLILYILIWVLTLLNLLAFILAIMTTAVLGSIKDLGIPGGEGHRQRPLRREGAPPLVLQAFFS